MRVLDIPADYRPGYEKARAVMPDVSDRYVEHTLIGDPLAEAMTKDLAGLGTRKTSLLIEAAMNEEGEEALRDAPASLRAFFNDAETPTEWLDYSRLRENVGLAVLALGVGSCYEDSSSGVIVVVGEPVGDAS